MTSDPTIFMSKNPTPHLSFINTADGSQLHVNHTGSFSISNLSLPATSYIPKLIINLIYIGQLCDLGLNDICYSSGCHVQVH